MKVAILFTGALRTIKKTIRYFKQNLLLTPDVDVFACIQNDTNMSDLEWEEWIRQEMGEHIKNIEWFSITQHTEWISIREKLISNLYITDNWKNYLRNSGSLIEYYQLYLAYIKMCNYEDRNQRYKYIIRSRTDTIFSKPVDFHWLNWTDTEVQERIDRINSELTLSNITVNPENTLSYFMTTILSNKLIPNIQNILPQYIPSSNTYIPSNATELNEYIKSGQYILTIRANNLYIISREFFNFIPTISFVYGLLKSPYNNDYWFNAENQFQAACYFSNLDVFDYNSLFEDKSLYEYDEKRYFDLDYNILNPHMLYCLVRN
jgi:hypothetical protein